MYLAHAEQTNGLSLTSNEFVAILLVSLLALMSLGISAFYLSRRFTSTLSVVATKSDKEKQK